MTETKLEKSVNINKQEIIEFDAENRENTQNFITIH